MADRTPVAVAIVVHSGTVLLVQRRVSAGELVWQFPAGPIGDGETAGAGAVREALEETGLVARADELLGERAHPADGRAMSYIACTVVEGTADVGHAEDLVTFAWASRTSLPEYVPHALFGPVQRHLDSVLTS